MKAAIYCRLSEEDRDKRSPTDDSESIRNQKAMLVRYAAEQGWEIYDIYSDDDYTGSDRKRPQFNRLLTDARERRFQVVLCKTQSRFTRELELVEKYIHGLFPLWGIRFVSIVDKADTANQGNKKSRQINGLVNEWYLEDMSENIRSVLVSRRRCGLHIGSFALYGYNKDPDHKGHLLPDPEAAAVVREVFTLFSQGYGKTAIARMLNDRGVPTPAAYKRLHGLSYGGQQTGYSLWRYSTISAMLHNEIYIGNMVQGKYGSVSYKTKQNRPRPKEQWFVVEGTHAPIIDRALWERVQQMLAARTRPFSGGSIGLFAGKAVCAHCGCVMRSSKSRGRHYLQCATHAISPTSCPGAFISVEKLETMVLEELQRLMAQYLDRSLLERNLRLGNGFPAREKRLRANLAAYQKRLAQCSDALRTIYLDGISGRIALEDQEVLQREVFCRQERLQHLAVDTQQELKDLRQSSHGDLEKYLNPPHLTRSILDFLVEKVLVFGRIPGTRDVPIEIHWRIPGEVSPVHMQQSRKQE